MDEMQYKIFNKSNVTQCIKGMSIKKRTELVLIKNLGPIIAPMCVEVLSQLLNPARSAFIEPISDSESKYAEDHR